MESKSSKNKNIVYYCLFVLLSFFITCSSTSLLLKEDYLNPDSYVYRYMGMLIAKGGLPYRDGFDNKGPFLYILNFLGYCINKRYGVWIIEFIFVLAFLIASYKLALKFLDSFASFICVVFSINSFGVVFEGNMNEEYALFFLIVSIYIFVDYFIFDRVNIFKIFICGLCFSAVFLLKPNMVILWPIFCIYVVVDYLVRQKKFPVKFTIAFFAGAVSLAAPFVIWMGVTGILNEYWKDCFLTNFMMTEGMFIPYELFLTMKRFFFESMMEVHLVFLLFLIYKRKNVVFNFVYILFMFLNLYMTSMSCFNAMHYGMILIPCSLYPSCAFVRYCFDTKLKEKNKLIYLLLAVASAGLFVFLARNISKFCVSMSEGNSIDPFKGDIISLIEENTDPDDEILVIGYACSYYVLSDRIAPTKFFYQLIHVHYPDGDDIMKEDINSTRPKMIIFENDLAFGDLYEHLDCYELIDFEHGVWLLKDEYTP